MHKHDSVTVLPRSIYQYSNMNLRLSGQTSIFGDVSLYTSLFWQLRDKKQKFISDPKASESGYWYIERGQTQSHVCARQFFCSQVFKTSDVLNSDENIVNIALITFCSLAVTKLAHWPMSSLLSCGVGLWWLWRHFRTPSLAKNRFLSHFLIVS